MNATLWGTRGSLATPGPDNARYGGNTSCVSVIGDEGTVLVLDAGTGIRRMASKLDPSVQRVDVLLTHLHMDHIQGLGFFGPLYRPGLEVHLWGPASTQLDLQARLMRYLSPPLFPIGLRELPCDLHLHELADSEVDIGEFRVASANVCHPGPTIGYRITDSTGRSIAYLPDHEPALGALTFPTLPRAWTSGAMLAHETDLLIHDSQYSAQEYVGHIGWGHSSLRHMLDFGTLVETRHIVPFHHDPGHSDDDLDRLMAEAIEEAKPAYRVSPACEGMSFHV